MNHMSNFRSGWPDWNVIGNTERLFPIKEQSPAIFLKCLYIHYRSQAHAKSTNSGKLPEIHVIFNSQVEKMIPMTVFPICWLCDLELWQDWRNLGQMNGEYDSPGPLKSSSQMFSRDYKLVHWSLKITGLDGSVLFTVTVCCVTLKSWGWAAGRKAPCSHFTGCCPLGQGETRADKPAQHRKYFGVQSRAARERKQHTQ